MRTHRGMAKVGRAQGANLPEWFPLATYDADLSLEQWLSEFVLRMAVRAKWENAQHLGPEEHRRTFLSLVAAETQSELNGLLDVDRPKRLWPIQAPSVLHVLYAAALMKTAAPELQVHIAALPDRADKFIETIFSDSHKCLSDVSFGEVGDHSQWTDVVGGKWALAAIDLDQDDETLEYIFKGWLASCREALGSPAPRAFDDTDRKRWASYQVLAAFDLSHWSAISGAKFTDAQMGRALWDRPGMDMSAVDLTERYRKTVKPMVDNLFRWNYVLRLWRQLEFLKVLDDLAAKRRDTQEGNKAD